MPSESACWTSSSRGTITKAGRAVGRWRHLATDDGGLLILKLLAFALLVVVAVVWAGVNAYAAYWIANNGKTSGSEGSPPAGAADVVYTANLHAWFTPPQAGRPTIVVVHGYQADRSHHAAEAAALRSAGYGTLQIDLGYVGGKAKFGGGGRETDEVMAAVTYASSRTGGGKVGILGFSAGGTDAILAASRGASVVAVAADSSPEGFVRLATDRVKVPRWLFVLTPVFYPRVSSGGHLVDVGDELAKATKPYTTPTLIIQGTADTTVAPSNGPALAKATKGQLWSVTGAGHTEAYAQASAEYLQRLRALFG